MKKIIIPALIAVVAGGCQFIPGTKANMVENAKKAVAATLKDPSSPMFTQITAVEDGVCGMVNGKNSFGAYAGNSRFVWTDTRILVEGTTNSNPGIMAMEACELEKLYVACKAGEQLLAASVRLGQTCSTQGLQVLETTYGLKAGSISKR